MAVDLQTKTFCSVEGCDNPSRRLGWCSAHSSRWYRHGSPTREPEPRPLRTCEVEGCERRHDARGMCSLHRARWARHGDPLVAIYASKGSTDITYSAAHRRITALFGKATEQDCVDCGGPASQWSFDHDAEIVRVDDNRGFPYSPDPSFYNPRCIPCHRIYDCGARR